MGVLGPIVPDDGANGTKDTNGGARPVRVSAFGLRGGARGAATLSAQGGAVVSDAASFRPSVPSVPIVPPAFEDDGWAGVDPDWDDAELWDIDKLLG